MAGVAFKQIIFETFPKFVVQFHSCVQMNQIKNYNILMKLDTNNYLCAVDILLSVIHISAYCINAV